MPSTYYEDYVIPPPFTLPAKQVGQMTLPEALSMAQCVSDPYAKRRRKGYSMITVLYLLTYSVVAFDIDSIVYWNIETWTFRVVLWIAVMIVWANFVSGTLRIRPTRRQVVEMATTLSMKAVSISKLARGRKISFPKVIPNEDTTTYLRAIKRKLT